VVEAHFHGGKRRVPGVDLAAARAQKCFEVAEHVPAHEREHGMRLVAGFRYCKNVVPQLASQARDKIGWQERRIAGDGDHGWMGPGGGWAAVWSLACGPASGRARPPISSGTRR